MSKHIPVSTCLACNRSMPAQEFARDSKICPFCAMLSPNDAVITALRTHETHQLWLKNATAGRKETRRLAKLAALESTGKRCTHCHARKPVSDYNKCAPMSDGLQPGCRACEQVRHTILTSTPIGGLAQWHIIRDALRAKNDRNQIL